MIRLAVFLFCACSAAMVSAEPLKFRETITIEGRKFPVPMQVQLRPTGETSLVLVVTGDLTNLQKNIPALLSRQIEETCKSETAVAVTDAIAEGKDLRLSGQLQLRRYLCLGNSTDSRAELLRQTANIDVVLTSAIREGCLTMQVKSVEIAPDGFTGAILNATGLTERLTGSLRERLDTAFGKGDNCIDIPDEFKAFDTEIRGGGFRETEAGKLGAVIRADMTVTSRNLIKLIRLLERKGRLGD